MMMNTLKMDNSLKKTNVNHNIIKLLQGRERTAELGRVVQQRLQFTHNIIKRLDLEYELYGHNGCVNCLQWSSDGRRLASGSDDAKVIIWDPFRHRSLLTLDTTHIGNIFSVKFLGNNDSLIATGAGDCRVLVQSIEKYGVVQTPLMDCVCHVGRVKRLATAPDQPFLFWSASEDGVVLQYDMRESHSCDSNAKAFIDLSYTSELKCITVNPVRSHLIAIGANDCFVRLLDRRMVKVTDFKRNRNLDSQTKSEPIDPRFVQYYAPGHLVLESGNDISQKFAVTYISFDSSGSSMLVNLGGEQIYIFDIDNPRHLDKFTVPDGLVKEGSPCCKSCSTKIDDDSISSLSAIALSRKLYKSNKLIALKSCTCEYIKRAKILYNRKWCGDVYAAARDYLHVIQHSPDNEEACVGLIECLTTLKWTEEAFQWLDYFQKLHPVCTDNEQTQNIYANLTPERKASSNERFSDKAISDIEKQLRSESRDYETSFVGHCNTTTDIKEANFLGEDANYICAGSDDGVIFIWNRKTTNVIAALLGDVSIVNCVQPHPRACFIATSGIDYVVKLWSPIIRDNIKNLRSVVNLWEVMEANQHRMELDPFETILVNMSHRLNPIEVQNLPSCRPS